MAAKDGSTGFDFEGVYNKVEPFLLEYKLVANRIGSIHFENNGGKVKITETFEPEIGNSESMQGQCCKEVINNFKKYAESILKLN